MPLTSWARTRSDKLQPHFTDRAGKTYELHLRNRKDEGWGRNPRAGAPVPLVELDDHGLDPSLHADRREHN